MRVRLSDIAIKTGYSVNTVSRSLRADPKISSLTRKTIQQAADEMGYVRNSLAGSMRSHRTSTLGIVSADSANPFFAEVLQGVEETARRNGYSILLINTDENQKREYEAVKLLVGRQVEGLISMPVMHSSRNMHLYQSLPVPFIFAGRRIPGMEDHSIQCMDVDGSRKVFEYLLGNGHQKILYLAGPQGISNSEDRLEGLAEAYSAAGNKNNERGPLVVRTNGHTKDGYEAVQEILRKRIPVTAIACFNDLLAMGALRSLHENEWKVPEDIEVIGYDNLSMSDYMRPRLSSVDIPKAELGQLVVEELLKRIQGGGSTSAGISLEPELVFRETTRRRGRMPLPAG